MALGIRLLSLLLGGPLLCTLKVEACQLCHHLVVVTHRCERDDRTLSQNGDSDDDDEDVKTGNNRTFIRVAVVCYPLIAPQSQV